jgi:glycosyltransferase involved in cell wall biosynthesis
MRILLLHNRYQNQGGEDHVLSQEQNLLQNKGHECELFLLSNQSISGKTGVLETAFNLVYSLKSKTLINKKLLRSMFDIVHVHNFFPLLTPSVYDACIEAGVPVVQTLHNYRTICPGALLMRDGKICETCVTASPYNGSFHKCYRDSFFASFAVARMVAYHRKKLTWQYKVNRFIALTEFGKNKFIEAGFPANKISVKPNFVEDPLKPQKIINHNRNGKALFVGRLSPEKGVDILIKAWGNIHHPLEIAGTGPLFSELKKNASDNVTFLGQLSKDEVIHKMIEASFLIMPSICYETFGLVIIEAFACGLPVVASRLGSMKEIIQDGITGMHFKAGDGDDLAEKINVMFASQERLNQMGINARNEYEEKYTPEKNYDMLMDIYNQVIEEHRAGERAKKI